MIACTSTPDDYIKDRYACAVYNEAAAYTTVTKQFGERSADSFRLPEASTRRIFGLYARALRQNRNLEGKIVFRISVLGSGDVVGFTTAHSDVSDCEFLADLAREFQTIRFEPINNLEDVSEFLFPLQFAGAQM